MNKKIGFRPMTMQEMYFMDMFISEDDLIAYQQYDAIKTSLDNEYMEEHGVDEVYYEGENPDNYAEPRKNIDEYLYDKWLNTQVNNFFGF